MSHFPGRDAPAPPPPPLRPPPGTPAWEYATHVMSISGFLTTGDVNAAELTNALNWHGAQGWELVSAVDTANASGGSKWLVLVFKRPRPGG